MKVLNFVQVNNLKENSNTILLAKKIKIALVSTQNIRLMQSSLPLTSARKLKQAAPFAVEDFLIENIEDLHFSVGKQDKTGSFPLAVVQKKILTDWYELLLEKGINAKYIIPDVLALSYTAESWHIFLNNNTVLIRLGPYQGISIELEQLALFLPLLFKEHPHPKEIQLSYTAEHIDHSIENLLPPDLPVVKAPHPTNAEKEFAKGLAQELNALNLLNSADFLKKIRQETALQTHNYTKWIFYTIWLVAFFWIINQISLLMVFKHRNDTLETQIQTLYYSFFSKNTPFESISNHINARLSTVYQIPSGIFLDIMIPLNDEIQKHNGTVVIHTLNFKNNILVLDLTAPELRTLNKVAAALQSYYPVQIDQVKPDANNEHVSAQMTIGKPS